MLDLAPYAAQRRRSTRARPAAGGLEHEVLTQAGHERVREQVRARIVEVNAVRLADDGLSAVHAHGVAIALGREDRRGVDDADLAAPRLDRHGDRLVDDTADALAVCGA